MSNLAARVLFAVVAIPIVLAAVYAGDLPLALLLAGAAGLAAWEFYGLARAAGYTPMTGAGVALAALTPIAVYAYHTGRFTPPVLTLGAAIMLIIFSLSMWLRGVDQHPAGATAMTLFGILYTGVMLSFAYALRYHNYAFGRVAGAVLLAYPLVVTWTSDSAAYFVGRAVGKRKLIPSVSPGKTIEGAIGAIVASVIVSWLYTQFVLPPYAFLGMRPVWAVATGVVLSVSVQLGDLAESLIKREAGVKDSSHLIPGHGGVLDRLDSLLFALPTMYLLLTFPHVLIPALR